MPFTKASAAMGVSSWALLSWAAAQCSRPLASPKSLAGSRTTTWMRWILLQSAGILNPQGPVGEVRIIIVIITCSRSPKPPLSISIMPFPSLHCSPLSLRITWNPFARAILLTSKTGKTLSGTPQTLTNPTASTHVWILNHNSGSVSVSLFLCVCVSLSLFLGPGLLIMGTDIYLQGEACLWIHQNSGTTCDSFSARGDCGAIAWHQTACDFSEIKAQRNMQVATHDELWNSDCNDLSLDLEPGIIIR